MRVVVFVKADADSEAGVMGSSELLEAMGRYNEELVDAGIMLGGDGLKPSSQGKRIGFDGASRIVNPYGLTDWPGVLELLRASGPAGVITRVRQAEAQAPDAQVPDDATVAHCTHLRH